MPALDILAHTSRFEAFGYVLLEALSAGVSIVTTRVGAADELVEDGVTGHVCSPWDAGTLAALLQRVIEEPERRSSISAAARTRAARFTVTAMVDSTAELYYRVSVRPNPTSVQSVTAVEDPH